MLNENRIAYYMHQNKNDWITPRQARRAIKKLNKNNDYTIHEFPGKHFKGKQ